MAKINMKSVLKAAGLLGLGATIGHITQVIYDYRLVEDKGDFNALGRFSWKVCEHWSDCANREKEKDELNREEETTVDEADDEWDAFGYDLPEKEEPSE